MLKLKKFSLIISLLVFLPLAAFGVEKQSGSNCLGGDTCFSKTVVLALNDSQSSGDSDKIRRHPRPWNGGFNSYPYGGFYPSYGFYPYGYNPYIGFGFYPFILLDNSGGDGSDSGDEGQVPNSNK